tara:strand:+ start:3437 stop:5617 length:2181 start_codon:yes stop_codon:yes gene_type:complete
MRKTFTIFFLTIFLFFALIMFILSTIGFESNRFNNLIKNKINNFYKNVDLNLKTVKFKLDLKELSLFLETSNPNINFRNAIIPAERIKVYLDFTSFLKFEPKIDKINLAINEIDIYELKKILVVLKPSNFKSFVSNKIRGGNLSAEIEFFMNDKNKLNNFIATGSISNLDFEVINRLNSKNTSFTFFADKSDILIKNFISKLGPIQIQEGDFKIKLSPEISIETNFMSNIAYNSQSSDFLNLIKNFQFTENIILLNANLKNNFKINFDKTYKITKYEFKSNGDVSKANLNIKENLPKKFPFEKVETINLLNSKFEIIAKPKIKNLNITGKYSINDENYELFKIDGLFKNNLTNLQISADFDDLIKIDFINYKKDKGTNAKIFLNLSKNKNDILIKELSFKEGKSSLILEGIKFSKEKISSFKNISVRTFNNKRENNDFIISNHKKIVIRGTQFDASNLAKFLKKKDSKNLLSNFTKDVEIDFANITVPLSEKLNNFKLIGKISKGKFIKISSKGDFGENNFLDISMKNDQKNNKQYLEIYSDVTKPLLTEYSFFKGLVGGKLLFSSVIEGNVSNSKLKIEEFKVVNAPGMVKLLSLADLGGLADLAEGEGLSFDTLEIKMEKNNSELKLNEIIAIGPSISVLMDGYQNQSTTSLRGTLVPAKNLNKIISKIPVLGDIVIPKEVGEGLFGISFKMKGPPGKIKTTINPIRTITPRFIQKIVDRKKTK